MDSEILCNQLMEKIPELLSKNNPELALLYYHAVLHMIEREKLGVEWLDKLISLLSPNEPNKFGIEWLYTFISTTSSLISFLTNQEKIQLYGRLLKVAENKKMLKQLYFNIFYN